MLDRMGHEVDLAADGEEGVALFAEHRHDLVVTDLLMPVMEGHDAIREIRRLAPDVKILAISGGSPVRPAEGGLAVAERMGADASLAKPFSSAQLQRTVDALLGEDG